MPSQLFFTQDKIRELYLDYFAGQKHLKLESFSLIPESDDKSLLLINAGMAPLKKYFSGQEVPPSKRVTTCQKCVRTNDIENVGKTARHATFFEMLGNFSFGDYFKDDSINWAWDFVTRILKLPEEKLFATVYEDDYEAFEIWEKKLKNAKKIFKMGKEDNFWEIGEGPCGPCSEIYFDRGEKFGCGGKNCQPGCDCDRFIEIWNLVFTQFNKNSDGSYSKLRQKNIDTGMGLERISVVMQSVNSIFEIDTMQKIIAKIADASKTNYGNNSKKDISIRIIADHIKAAVFMISDDIFVSNEGRGYILRRLIRRAVCRMKILGIESNSFLRELAGLVINIFGRYYKNLVSKKDEIMRMLSEEQKKFNDTLLTGLNMFMDLIDKAERNGKKIISGHEAFKLHDTFGCNMELMQEIADENEIIIDKKEFVNELEKQKQRARESQINQTSNSFDLIIQEEIKKLDVTEFLGYENFKFDEANILMLIDNEIRDEVSGENDFWIIFDKTIFFAEESGQISDSGILKTDTGTANIISCKKILGDKYVHRAKLVSGVIKKNQKASLQLDIEKRERIARNHTATHLLHKILREKIFADTKQMGSYIDNNYFRFDFLCKRTLSKEDMHLIENELNRKIFDDLEVKITNRNINDAISSGVTALFDEKYGDIVRVVNIGGYSMELCSGTHVKNTSQINCFKIIGESGVSAGVRRIEAVTGPMAVEFYNKTQSEIDKACKILKSDKNNLLHKLENVISEGKKNKSKIVKLENILASQMAKKICENYEVINDIKLAFDFCNGDDFDLKFLREIGDKIKNDLKSCVIVLAAKNNDQVNLIFERTEDLNFNAGEIVKNIAKKFGANGGGRKNYAQLGGLKSNSLNLVLKEIKEIMLSVN